MSLTAITPYGPTGASSRVRVLGWFKRFDAPKTVHSYLGAANASPRTLLARAPEVWRAERALRALEVSDATLFLHREASPLSSGHLESQLLRRARHSVYDFDDALQWDVRHGLRSLGAKHLKAERSVRAADVVVAGSDLLADWASRFAREVHLVPSCVEPADYLQKVRFDVGAGPIIGWVGSPSTEKYLRLLELPLLALHERLGARLLVVSAGQATLGALDPMVDRVPWAAATVGPVMTSFDVAIAPLPAELYARGKCAYKIVQYAAAALPIVGSAVGANRLVLGRLGAGAATDEQDWITQLTDIVTASPQDRASMGATARRAVEQHYSFAAWQDTMGGLLGLSPHAASASSHA